MRFEMVVLAMPASYEGDTIEVAAWDVLAQDDNNQQAKPETLEDGDILAMETRDDLRLEWPGERIFVQLDGDTAYLFVENGNLYVSPFSEDSGVQHALHFTEQWKSGFYRIPRADAGDGADLAPASAEGEAKTDDEDDEGMAISGLLKIKKEKSSPALSSPSPHPSPSP